MVFLSVDIELNLFLSNFGIERLLSVNTDITLASLSSKNFEKKDYMGIEIWKEG